MSQKLELFVNPFNHSENESAFYVPTLAIFFVQHAEIFVSYWGHQSGLFGVFQPGSRVKVTHANW